LTTVRGDLAGVCVRVHKLAPGSCARDLPVLAMASLDQRACALHGAAIPLPDPIAAKRKTMMVASTTTAKPGLVAAAAA